MQGGGLRPRSPRWAATAWTIARRTVGRTRRQDLSLVTAGLTFYAALTIVPLALFGLYGAGLVLGAARVDEIVDGLAGFVGGPLGLDDALREAGRVGPRLGLPALGASLVTASFYGEGLLRAVEAYEPGGPPSGLAWRGRLHVVPYVLAFPLLVVVALLAGEALDGALGSGIGARLLGIYLAFLLGWVLLTVQLAFVYRVFTPGRPSAPAVVWGAASAASFLAGMSLGWIPLLRLGVDVGRAYGGSDLLGRLVLAGIYLLLFQLVLLVGVLLVRTVDEHRRDRAAGQGA